MEQFNYFIGIDVSKKKLDLVLLNVKHECLASLEVSNNSTGLKLAMKKLKELVDSNWSEVLFCLEHTGIYCRPFLEFAAQLELKVWLQHALHIKRSIGMTRGKSDQVDAARIAEYALRFRDKVSLWEDEGDAIKHLRVLITTRTRLLKMRMQAKAHIKETQSLGLKTESKLIEKYSQNTLKSLDKDIKNIEKQIRKLLKEEKELAPKAELIMSIPGIGMVTASLLLIHTKGFEKFDSPRQVASYCGIAPFPNSSGKTQKPNRISHLANKVLKTALTMAAMSAIQHCDELKQYYQRKIAEGKLKMRVLNAVRNKLVHRAFAIVKRGTPYVAEFSVTKENSVA